ncbi:hypothetical protein ABBQ38_009595 [Trebouxia sp. C0009 RCD-2024]
MHSFDQLQRRHPNMHLKQDVVTCIGRLLANIWLGSNAPNAGVSPVPSLHQHLRKASAVCKSSSLLASCNRSYSAAGNNEKRAGFLVKISVLVRGIQPKESWGCQACIK